MTYDAISSVSDPNADSRASLPRRMTMPQILRAAEHVFGKHGFRGASMADIAREAELPKANIHYYFRTKEDLYRSVLENIITVWLDDAELWLTPGRSARSGFEGYIRSKMKFSADHPDASRIFAHEILQGAENIRHFLTTTLRTTMQRLAATFTIWQERGEMRDIDAFHLLFCLWSMTQGYADMSAQMCAALGRTTLNHDDYETGVQTITTLILNACTSDAKASKQDQ